MIGTYLQFRRHFTRRSIRADAAKGVYTCKDRTEHWLGDPCPFDPLGNSEHQRLAELANCDGELAERKAALEEQERQWALGDRPFVLTAGLLLFLSLEAVSMVGLVATLGHEAPERLIYGLGGAAGLFALLSLVMTIADRLAEPLTAKEN